MPNNKKHMITISKKRKYRRKRKTLKGGQITSSNPNLQSTSPSILNELLSLSGQTLGNISEWLMNKTASYLNIDPNLSTTDILDNYSKRIYAVKQVLNSPEGKLLLKDANDLVVITSKNVLGPAVTNMSEDVINSSGKLVTEGTNAVVNAISEVPGPNVVIASARLFGNAINAANEASKLGTKIFHTSNETLDKLDKYKDQANSILGRLENLVQQQLNNLQQVNSEWSKYNNMDRVNIGKQLEQNIKPNNISQNLRSNQMLRKVPLYQTQRGGKGHPYAMFNTEQIQHGGKVIQDRINITTDMFKGNL